MAEFEKIPERERFSLIYGRQGAPGSDSERMRTRLGVLIANRPPEQLYDAIRGKLGCPVPLGFNGVTWVRFFEEAKLRDVLDTVTLAYDAIQAGRYTASSEAERFLREVNLIFQEEHLTYRADKRGVVRFTVDEQFEADRAAIIEGLQRSRFAAAAKSFDEARKELAKTPRPNGKGAIEATFEAAENIFKVMFKNEPRLTDKKAREQLTPVMQRIYDGNDPAKAAAPKQSTRSATGSTARISTVTDITGSRSLNLRWRSRWCSSAPARRTSAGCSPSTPPRTGARQQNKRGRREWQA